MRSILFLLNKCIYELRYMHRHVHKKVITITNHEELFRKEKAFLCFSLLFFFEGKTFSKINEAESNGRE